MASRTRVKIDRSKLRKEVRAKIGEDNEPKVRTKAVAREVQAYWKYVAWPNSTGNHGPGVHPYAHFGVPDSYQDSIEIRRNRNLKGRFVAGWTVFSNHPNANFIEFGTGVDKPGSRSPWGPITPTPEFAPAAHTAIAFRGSAP